MSSYLDKVTKVPDKLFWFLYDKFGLSVQSVVSDADGETGPGLLFNCSGEEYCIVPETKGN